MKQEFSFFSGLLAELETQVPMVQHPTNSHSIDHPARMAAPRPDSEALSSTLPDINRMPAAACALVLIPSCPSVLDTEQSLT